MKMLDLLRERALRVKLKASPQFGGAVDVPSVVKFLDAMNESFLSYVEAEARNAVKGKHTAVVEKEIKKLKEDARLLFVDLDFQSFEASLAPNSVTAPHHFTSVPGSGEFKQKVFEHYQKEVIFSDPNSETTLRGLEKRFSADERRAIFDPLYKGVFSSGQLEFYAGKPQGSLKRLEKRPTPEALVRLVPERIALPGEPEHRFVKLYAEVTGDPDLFGERKLKVLKKLAVEEMEHATYPYQFQTIGFGGTTLQLAKTYSATVRFDDETSLYHVDFDDLDIHTWGDSRAEAVEAFEFSFTDMAEEFLSAKEKDLTVRAKEFKKVLKEMIVAKSKG